MSRVAPESNKSRQSERPRHLTLRGALAVGALTVAVAGCGSSKPSDAVESRPISNGNSVRLNDAVSVSNGDPSNSVANFSWGKRVKLRRSTFGKWNPRHPEPVRKAVLHPVTNDDPYLLVGDDARYNFPADPNPNTDDPTGLYSKPTQKSDPVVKVPDGTVLKVTGWTDEGQYVPDAHGGKGYRVWEKVMGHDGTEAWGPWVNLGYTALRLVRQLPKAHLQP